MKGTLFVKYSACGVVVSMVLSMSFSYDATAPRNMLPTPIWRSADVGCNGAKPPGEAPLWVGTARKMQSGLTQPLAAVLLPLQPARRRASDVEPGLYNE